MTLPTLEERLYRLEAELRELKMALRYKVGEECGRCGFTNILQDNYMCFECNHELIEKKREGKL